MKNIPNTLTVLRAVLTIVLVILFYLDFPYKFTWILIVFIVASLTDTFDGAIARKYQLESVFGKVFDSLFDKIFTLSMYMLLMPYDIVHDTVFIALLMREIFIDGLKNYFLAQGKPVSPKITGKLKFIFQVIMISTMLVYLIYPENEIIYDVVLATTGLALFFAYISAYFYTKDFVKFLRS